MVNLELLVGNQVIVSRSIRTKAEPEGSSISSAKVVVCLPLVLMVGGDILLSQMADSGRFDIPKAMSLPPPAPASIAPSSGRPTPKPTSLTGRIGAALGVLVLITIAAFFSSHPQYGPKVVVKHPDKTQQDAKDHGQISPPDKTEQEKLEEDKRVREEYQRMLNEGRSRYGTDALAVKPPDKTQLDNDWEAFIDIDRRDIDLLMVKLSTALSNKSASELQEIWPQAGGEKAKALAKREFGSAQTISRTFHIESLRFSPHRQTADVSGSYEGKIISEGKESPSSGKFNMKLSKRDGKWYIHKATF